MNTSHLIWGFNLSNHDLNLSIFSKMFSLVDITLECPKENNNLRKQLHVHSCHNVGQFISDVFLKNEDNVII